MLAKRVVSAKKLSEGVYVWKKRKKVAYCEKKSKGGPFGPRITFANNFFWFSARLELTYPCFSDLATWTRNPRQTLGQVAVKKWPRSYLKN